MVDTTEVLIGKILHITRTLVAVALAALLVLSIGAPRWNGKVKGSVHRWVNSGVQVAERFATKVHRLVRNGLGDTYDDIVNPLHK